MRKTAFLILTAFVLSACAGGDRGLRDLRSPGGGPDEFSVLPVAPLELPQDLSALPRPTPGGTNRTDPYPQAEAVAALGGSLAAVNTAGVPASDAALVNAAGRDGIAPDIRATLAAEDEAFRTRRARLGIFSGPERYFRAYAAQALDAQAELSRFRNLGVAVPSAPPAE